MPVDNALYDRLSETWWDEDECLALLRTSLNPARFGYFREVLTERLGLDPRGTRALDIGCGGGLLAEEFAGIGCQVTGIDPSEASLETARKHADQAGLEVDYRHGFGEELPFPDESFDVAYCCDVLEHVNDLDRVIAETARVLKPGGVYFYDTINRTLPSKLLLIKLFQEWKSTAFMPPNLHDWNMFIKPKELRAVLARHGLQNQDLVGLRPEGNPLSQLALLRKRARGEAGYRDLGDQIKFRRSRDKTGLYMGYALKLA